MSAELARLLLRAGAGLSDVEQVLEATVVRRTNLLAILAERRPELLELIDRELVRAEVPSLEIVRPQADLVGILPPGLCENLGALPVRRDPRSGRIDVAVLDPLDPHVALELEHHLDAPVRLFWVRFEVFDAALRAGTLATARLPSAPPLPLVRKAPQPRAVGGSTPSARDASRAESPADDDDEPVLSLTRSKPRQAPLAGAPPQPQPQPLDKAVDAIVRAQNPDDVVAAVVAGIHPALALVLAVRGQAYEGRAGSPGFDAQRVRRIRIPAGTPSVVETAVRQSYYLGILPLSPAHGSLRELLGGDAEAEVYVAPVSVSGRPSLIVVVGRLPALGASTHATRRIDELCRVAGQVLENIVVSKKRGGIA